jgi:hypothetical protein
MDEPELERKKNNSITEERKALESLEAYYAAISTQSGRFNPDDLLKMVNKVGSAIGVHRNHSENYILYLKEQLRRYSSGIQ